jgi:hypothetical protein
VGRRARRRPGRARRRARVGASLPGQPEGRLRAARQHARIRLRRRRPGARRRHGGRVRQQHDGHGARRLLAIQRRDGDGGRQHVDHARQQPEHRRARDPERRDDHVRAPLLERLARDARYERDPRSRGHGRLRGDGHGGRLGDGDVLLGADVLPVDGRRHDARPDERRRPVPREWRRRRQPHQPQQRHRLHGLVDGRVLFAGDRSATQPHDLRRARSHQLERAVGDRYPHGVSRPRRGLRRQAGRRHLRGRRPAHGRLPVVQRRQALERPQPRQQLLQRHTVLSWRRGLERWRPAAAHGRRAKPVEHGPRRGRRHGAALPGPIERDHHGLDESGLLLAGRVHHVDLDVQARLRQRDEDVHEPQHAPERRGPAGRHDRVHDLGHELGQRRRDEHRHE